MRDQLQIGDAAAVRQEERKSAEHKTNAAGKGRKSIAISPPFAVRCRAARKLQSDERAILKMMLL